MQSLLPVIAAGMLLAGCAANDRPSDQYLAEHGYWYHDAITRMARAGPRACRRNSTHPWHLAVATGRW
jgi:hypothetical protein